MAKGKFDQVPLLIQAMRGRHYGITYDEIEELLDCGRRTAQRWVQYLVGSEWACPTEPDDRGRRRWKLTPAAKDVVALPVSPTELLAQCLAIQAAAPLVAGTELHGALESATRRIADALPDRAQAFGAEALAAFPAPPAAEQVRLREELLEDLLEATVSHRILDVVYRPLSRGGAPKQYRLRPLAVFPHKGVLYVAAIGGDDAKDRRPFYFAVHRFDELTMSRETFKPPPGFDAREFVQKSFGAYDGATLDVRVRFDAKVAPFVRERRFHHSQQLTERSDGGVDVRLNACGWPEIKAWVLSWGAHAELLSPADKRKELAREAADLARLYGTTGRGAT